MITILEKWLERWFHSWLEQNESRHESEGCLKSKYLGYPKISCDRKERRATGPETLSHMRPPFLSGKEGAVRKIGTHTLAIVGIYLLMSHWAASVGSSCVQWAADTCSPSSPWCFQEPGIQGQLQQPWATSLHSLWLTLSGVTRTQPALPGARHGGNKAHPGNLGRALCGHFSCDSYPLS